MYAKAKVGGFLHLAIGEEATIVGSARAMRDDDYLISTYRSHGHALVRGTTPTASWPSCSAASTAAPAGAAARCTCSTSSGASWAATGSSAATCRSPPASAWPPTTWAPRTPRCARSATAPPTRAPSARRMNLAALWKLPVVFMVTNNQFGMGTALERHSAVTDLQRKGEGFGVPGMECDGMDVLDTYHGHPGGAAHRARGAPPGARRGDHLPLPRPLDGRPRGVPHQGAGRGVAQARPDPAVGRPPRGRGDRQRRRARAVRRRTRSRSVDDAVAFADESPMPAARVALRRRLRPRRPGPRLVLGRRALGRRAQGRGRARARRAARRSNSTAGRARRATSRSR